MQAPYSRTMFELLDEQAQRDACAVICNGQALTYKQLAVNDLPAVDYPVISVSVSYPGANPETNCDAAAGSDCTQLASTERNALRWPSPDGRDCAQSKAARASVWAHCRATLFID